MKVPRTSCHTVKSEKANRHTTGDSEDEMNEKMNLEQLSENWPEYNSKFTRDSVLLRFMSKKYFLDMINNSCNTLMHVSTWSDVYEGLIYKLKYYLKDNNGVYQSTSLNSLYKYYYGQCWSLLPYASEVLWNARCRKGDGVCIKTTVGKLAANITAVMEPKWVGVACDLKRVKYRSSRGVKSFVNQMSNQQVANAIQSSFPGLMGLFFVKRNEFSDEKEVRLLVSDPQQGAFVAGNSLVSYKVDKTNFLEEVILDPRMGRKTVSQIKKVVSKVGWLCNGQSLKVTQSDLYDFPPKDVYLD